MRPKIPVLCQIALSTILATPLNAADEIQDNVPLDMVKALLANSTPFDIRLYAGVPDHFPAINIPDAAELLGSADMGNTLQIVMRAEGDGMRQRSQIINELESQGYVMLTQIPGASAGQTGFVTPRFIPPGMPVQLCHDTHGVLTVRISGANPSPMGGPRMGFQAGQPGVTFNPFVNVPQGVVSTTTSAITPTTSTINVTSMGGASNPRAAMMAGQSCTQMQEQFSGRAQAGPARVNLMLYMPRMELPPAATLSSTQPGTSMQPSFTSGLPLAMESRIDMSLDWAPDAVFRHVADQIDQQDWQRDHESSGNVSASGSWTKETEEMHLLGSLRVLNLGDTQYQLQFFIQSLPVPNP